MVEQVRDLSDGQVDSVERPRLCVPTVEYVGQRPDGAIWGPPCLAPLYCLLMGDPGDEGKRLRFTELLISGQSMDESANALP